MTKTRFQARKGLHKGWFLIHLGWVCLAFTSVPEQDNLLRIQYEKQIREIASSVKRADQNYGEIEKGLKSLFPKGTHKSPFYTSIEVDFQTFRESLGHLKEYRTSLNSDRKSYTKLFSVGLLKSVDSLGEEDENWEEARNLADRMNETIVAAQNELNRLEPLHQTLSSFILRLDDVTKFRKELQSNVKQTAGEFENISDESQNLLRKFQVVDTRVIQFRAYENGDSIRQLLVETTQAFGATKDSVAALRISLEYLLQGESKSGDEQYVWELYETIVERKTNLTEKILNLSKHVKVLQEHLQNIVELLREFGKLLGELDEGIALLIERQRNHEVELEVYRGQFTALFEAAPSGLSTEDMPYRDLKYAFQKCENNVFATGGFLTKAQGVRAKLITYAGKILHLGEQESTIFRQLKKEFDEIKKEALEQYEQYAHITDTFRNIIRLDFINTQQYWELEYKVEEKTLRGVGQVLEENYGYLYDPNEYPEKLYHGKLISTFQLRMRRLRPEGGTNWDYFLVFEGSNDFAIEGMMLVDGDSILYRVSRENIEDKKETTESGYLRFVWEMAVNPSILRQLIQSKRPILKIHFLTVSHRINTTLYNQKLFREYRIPGERLKEWKNLLFTDIPAI